MDQMSTVRPMAHQPFAQGHRDGTGMTIGVSRWVSSATIFFFALLIFSGCSATERLIAKKPAVHQDKIPAREARPEGTEKKTASAVTSPSEAKNKKTIPQVGTQRRTGQTTLETVKSIAGDLAKKNKPVENMTICYAQKRDEWWITLFQDNGHAFELKRYIWNKRDDKIEPFLVPKTIPRSDLADYLNEKPIGKECTAFAHTQNGWTAMKDSSSKPHPTASPQERSKPPAKAKRRAHQSQPPKPKDLRLLHGDEQPPPKVRNVSIPLRRSSTDYVFAYGSEMKHTDLLKWLGAHGYDTGLVADASAGRLDGYGFVWNYYSPVKRGGTANIEPRKDAVVWGLLWELDSRLITAMDRKQGTPMSYGRGRKRIPVRRIEDGRTVLAWVYTAKPNRNGRTDIWPTPKYKKRIVEAATFWGFPRQYVDKIRKWNTSP